MQIPQRIYLQDYIRHSIALTQRKNDTGLYDYNGRQIELFHMKLFNCG